MRGWPLLAALALAACSGSGEPGEDDIRAALTQAGNRGGPQAVKLACKQGTDKPGFVCDYRAPACNRFTGKCGSPKPGSGRFVRAGGRWQLVEDLTPRAAPDPVTQPPPVQPTPTPFPSFSPAPGASPAPFPSFSPSPGATPGRPRIWRPTPTPAPDWEEEEEARAPLEPRDIRLIARWIGLNARCRIGENSSDESLDACAERDDLAQRMRRRGLCYGGGGRDTVAKWHRCD